MPRFISPITDIKPLGSVSFFDSNTNLSKVTYKDELESIENTLTIPVDAGGNLPNIFFSGSASVVYLDQYGAQYAARNPVGEEVGLGNFTAWSNVVDYEIGDIAIGSDGGYYVSLTNGNQGNDPTTSSSNWQEIRFLGVWNASVNYLAGDVAQTANGNLWASQGSQAGNNPSSDDGTNWLPAVSGASIPEIITLDAQVTTVIPQTGGGALSALRENELRDGGAYTLPLASSILANQKITISLPVQYGTFEPVVSVTGIDTISDNAGTDTSITFKGATKISLTSNGVSNWGL